MGTSLRASGWTPESRVRGRGWHSARWARPNTNSWIGKVRWGKSLIGKRQVKSTKIKVASDTCNGGVLLDTRVICGDRYPDYLIVGH